MLVLLHVFGWLLLLVSVEVRSALARFLEMSPPARERELKQCFAASETLHSLIRQHRCYLTLEETRHTLLDKGMLTSLQMIGCSVLVFLPTQHPLSHSHVPTDIYVSAPNENKTKHFYHPCSLLIPFILPSVLPLATQPRVRWFVGGC